jgi:hypothetical protein
MINRDVIFEFYKVGAYTKVTAMDTKTLIEVSIQGSSNSPESILKNNALRRLEYVLKKRNKL